jgi:hypothetical protein
LKRGDEAILGYTVIFEYTVNYGKIKKVDKEFIFLPPKKLLWHVCFHGSGNV